MVPRYTNSKIAENSSDINKLNMWQAVELAVILALEQMGIFPQGIYEKIKTILDQHPIDEEAVKWWKARDKEIGHDLNAFLDLLFRYLPKELHQHLHLSMTSFDTEDPAFSLILLANLAIVENEIESFLPKLAAMAKKYRYTPMFGRTHGQAAKLQSFGKRCFTWYKGLLVAFEELQHAKEYIKFSKLSGAIGNYQGLTPEVELKVLEHLGLKPFKGATQIIPRILHQPLANALVMVVASLTQIAEDIRLVARSGLPLMQEPFGKKQKGSSAMPHKKNTITCENQIGMFKLAKGFASILQDCQVTWEERSIEQSGPERVAWQDLFHVVMQSFKNMDKLFGDLKYDQGGNPVFVNGLQIYPDNMMREIINSKGCYASEDAKDWLKDKLCTKFSLEHEDVYRLVQLAAFNAHEPTSWLKGFRQNIATSFDLAHELLKELVSYDYYKQNVNSQTFPSILTHGILHHSEELDISEETIDSWNEILKNFFSDKKNQEEFEKLFTVAYQLRGEYALFEELK